ncbi:MAG: UDP-N-acetylglucosamine--N-acetylmuramyl-(pentapeptide) pyrophosphoryl-undecaprenol N-acetylglucosamine transferase [Thermacetogenium phaeum]|jgi:UDP-N-acetylglucosamine--N-acetylmuramyl-(pentapeptide) pyrophosphoryl-undecaprenol N-acetylglucosamine transferase|uniref:UDP-N-acetylglucosamine--N-acetylmuramyl-(pentapeptide) pyrophosphoryl-undecaprenol N-acetylglucosamine transferase n=1 Tax=Thermacetogenium phaeum TaxID=85874 RepID=A0A124FKF1_9THEO|nr:MAG: UDP-N-acetylglucosamine--N-acetylmuramyl-(pentapeptide) pyrophosphoryl-undecaprenol N-acetylglucosamine transferase [Thermacetogenium phaeum]
MWKIRGFQKMRVLITGGGTGGHLYPALAVAGLLEEYVPSVEILFVGTGEGLESTVVPAAGYSFRRIAAVKWPRRLSFKVPGVFWGLGKGYLQGIKIIKEFRPDAVFATGGYVSVPVGLAAVRRGVPLFLHEQNAVPGMANRLLARWATVTFTTFPLRKETFPQKANSIHSGLPVRKEILRTERRDGLRYFGFDDDCFTLLVTGGSRGARRINIVMQEVYLKICAGETSLPGLQVIHLTGRDEYPAYCRMLSTKGICGAKIGKLVIRPYLDKMEYALAAADLVVSRAGAATLAELTARGLPAVLVPYPYATGDHQYHNARYLEETGAAVLIREEDLTAERLLREIGRIVGDRQLRKKMAEQSLRLGRPEAGEVIVRTIIEKITSK